MTVTLGLLAIICCCCTGVSSYSTGPPVSACDDMTPHHDNNTAMTSETNYTITLSNNTYKPGDTITVTLSSSDGAAFKGVFLQARLAKSTSDKSTQGTFNINQDEAELKNVACGNANGAVSHSSSVDKTSKQVVWKAPSTNVGDIQFRATFVKIKAEFWTNVLSEVVTGKNSVAHTSVNCLVVLFSAALALLPVLNY